MCGPLKLFHFLPLTFNLQSTRGMKVSTVCVLVANKVLKANTSKRRKKRKEKHFSSDPSKFYPDLFHMTLKLLGHDVIGLCITLCCLKLKTDMKGR